MPRKKNASEVVLKTFSLTSVMKNIGMLQHESGWEAYAQMDSNGWPVIKLYQPEFDREKYVDPTPDELWLLQMRGWFKEFEKVDAYTRHYKRKHNPKKEVRIVREIPEAKKDMLQEVMNDLLVEYPELVNGLTKLNDDEDLMYTLLYDTLAKASYTLRRKK